MSLHFGKRLLTSRRLVLNVMALKKKERRGRRRRDPILPLCKESKLLLHFNEALFKYVCMID